MVELTQRQAAPPPSDPREVARGVQFLAVLSGVCFAVGRVASLDPDRAALTGVSGLLYAVLLLMGLPVLGVWLRRVRANAELLSPGVQPFTPGWAMAGWLVPGLSLVMRWPITLGLWRASGVPGRPVLVHTWLGTTVAGMVAYALAAGPHPSVPAVWAASAIMLAGCVQTALVVQRITRRQAEALGLPAEWPARPGEEIPRERVSP
ncbi:DUF4328 domain-containing protein [Kitasatospora sp. NPDC101183]|uniref:DUF4328 domain-containing protein n=1 Tax=Kitasatospora sp. NPDC101183 TaxID=3364100 RepID=UPI00380EE307